MGWKFRGEKGIRAIAEKAGWAVEQIDKENSIYLTFVLKPK